MLDKDFITRKIETIANSNEKKYSNIETIANSNDKKNSKVENLCNKSKKFNKKEKIKILYLASIYLNTVFQGYKSEKVNKNELLSESRHFLRVLDCYKKNTP